MSRPRDERRAAEAVRLYSSGLTCRQVARKLLADPRSVAGWVGDDLRKRGTRPRTDVTDAQVWELRYGEEKCSYEEIARRTTLSKTAVRKRINRMGPGGVRVQPVKHY